MPTYRFSQVNVFSASPLNGNPLAVVHDADDLSEDQMFALARWTNLSETTFLLKPTHLDADYCVRIFTPQGELPFAGHPTLGSCHVWLMAGGAPIKADRILQQCGVGLVSIRRNDVRLEFSAPPLIRSGPIAKGDLAQIARGLGLSVADIAHHQWVDNGPGWCAVMLDSAERVLSIKPDWATLLPFNLGVVGPHRSGADATVEVRAFIGRGGYEDPVTGSLNASLAQWLMAAGLVSSPYTAAQGTVMQRAGRVHLSQTSNTVWVGGQVVDVIQGEITL
ncbi:PhzF family phenazine biosynthesis protein [Marinobacter sp. ATCH36]|uniref:PhzF family phenazine biosynthesis protein n=1 Tax=Marinobacter sp. ATCH36 TaxID=2945106 RepID=UPI002021EB32|nr:PhzF family phenazine biosynthesis protein [Marinobacter sp. ATCH36]MCL7944774.1 PhzF family phenazine biosynthesis protein [Marinobacter sp. ATCH36]